MTDAVVIVKPDVNPDAAHDQKMIDKVDAVNAAADKAANPPADTQPEAPVKPEGIPDKFWDAEKGEVRVAEMAKSYSELESKQGKQADPAKPADGEPAPKAEDADAAKAIVEGAGVNFDELSAEFAQKGELSEESYEKLTKGGIPKATVDQYIAGQKALALAIETDIKSVAGGEEGFSNVVDWAKDNLPKEELEAYNKAIDSKDVAASKLAVAGITAKYKDANPDEPSLVSGRSSGSSNGDVYESIAELTADQKKPEYKKDPAFRKRVEAKLGRSKIL